VLKVPVVLQVPKAQQEPRELQVQLVQPVNLPWDQLVQRVPQDLPAQEVPKVLQE
jgi:hypothetical protein